MSEQDSPFDESPPDAVELWRSLRDYLQVDLDVDVPESPNARSPVTVKIKVTNVAPTGPDWPEVEFEEVAVEIGLQSSISNRTIGTVTSGQSLTFEQHLEVESQEVV